MQCLFFIYWLKRNFAEGFHHGRAGIAARQFFVLVVFHLHRAEPSLHEILVEIQRLIIPVIVVILLIRRRTGNPRSPRAAGNHRLESHLAEL